MPGDRQIATTSNPPRPLLPTLASNRPVRSPITPKLGGDTKPSTVPLSRRSAQSAFLLSPSSLSTESLITPSKSFLINNVTPRSSRRQSRVGTTNVTPASLPRPSPGNVRPASPASPPKAVDTRQLNKGHGIAGAKSPLGIAADAESKSSPGYFASIPGVLPQAWSGPGAGIGGGEESQLFFRANDAKAQTRPKRPPMATKTSSFYYANGEELQVQSRSQAASTTGGSDDVRSESKFSRVNDGPELQSVFQFQSSPGPMPSPMSEVQPAEVFPARLHGPPSPLRESIHLSYRKGASQVIRPVTQRPSILRLPTMTSTNDLASTRRRSNTEVAARRPSQTRTTSVGSIATSVISTASTGIVSNSPALFLSELGLSNTPALGTPLQQVESQEAVPIANDARSDISTRSGLPLHSPTKLNGPAASARHERKVLDLEISNSSLLAVNRTLEREVRKQKSELRRFRRLSRTGRLSLATTCSSVDGLQTLVEDNDTRRSLGLTDNEQLEDDYLSDADSFDDDDALSPGALAERDAKHRAEDERRLQADLSRHRDLLVDSSRMNQSIKRCLDWTDELITEGKKALEYRVRVSDVKLGGRVLAHDDEEEERKEAVGEDQEDGRLARQERRNSHDGRGLVGSDRTSWDSGLGLESPGKITDDASGDKT